MRKYDTVLFDLDGTLTESSPGIFGGIRHTLQKMNWAKEPPEVVLRSFIGPPLHTSFSGTMGMSEAETQQAVSIYRAYYGERGYLENAVYVGLPNLLKALKAQGTRIYLATAKPEAIAIDILKAFGLYRYFDGARGVSMEGVAADKGEIIRSILPENPGRAVMVGDRGTDIKGARENGIDSIAVGYGFGDEAELRAERPTAYAADVPALYACLLGDTPPPKGLFWTLEGVDGSGKTTQMKKLVKLLADLGHAVLCTREPGGEEIAEGIRELLLDPKHAQMLPETEALLYAAARAQHVRRVIRPALAAGKIVLCDRFLDSSMAYQGAGRGLGVETVRQANQLALDGLSPDLTFLFTVEPKTAARRRAQGEQADRMEREAMAFHQRVAAAYEEIAAAEPERVHRVNAEGPVKETAAQVARIARRALEAR